MFFQIFIHEREKLKGTLEPGKYADFVVVSKNPLTCPISMIPEIQVKMTVQAGHVIYSDDSIDVPSELSYWSRLNHLLFSN